MKGILKDIYNQKLIDLEVSKKKCSLQSLIKLLPNNDNRNFKYVLNESQKNKKNNIIAEIKKHSPSAGEIIKDYHPDKIARKYEKAGVGAISILTESSFFKGNLDHLSLIKKTTNIPILRKDFIIDKYQIFESKVYKADAILLITSILSDNQIKEFIKISEEIGLDCIIETHTAEELKRAIKINYPIIGINNRNLDTLSINTNNTLNLIKGISKDFIIISESGIRNKRDIDICNKSSVYNFLIGESILKSKNIEIKLKELLQ